MVNACPICVNRLLIKSWAVPSIDRSKSKAVKTLSTNPLIPVLILDSWSSLITKVVFSLVATTEKAKDACLTKLSKGAFKPV